MTTEKITASFDVFTQLYTNNYIVYLDAGNKGTDKIFLAMFSDYMEADSYLHSVKNKYISTLGMELVSIKLTKQGQNVKKDKIKQIFADAITFSYYSDKTSAGLLSKMGEFTQDVLFYFRHNQPRQQLALIDLMAVEFGYENITFSVNQKFICKQALYSIR